MADSDESESAYQATRAWLEQSPPGFICPKVVPSIVNLRDVVLQPLPPEQEAISLRTPGKIKGLISAAVEGLDGLDKEEANLVFASPWTAPLTQIVTNQTAASPQQALEQLQACASVSPRKVCQYPFKRNDIVWMCRTCQADDTCAMCHECYNNSDHEGHDVAFYHAPEGGCCDCGDPDAWDEKGFCSNHGQKAGGEDGGSQQKPVEDLLPAGLVPRVKGVVPAILDWMIQRLVTTAQESSQRTTLPLAEAEALIGSLGRQGHGLYIVLQADDIHGSTEFSDALRQFLGSSTYLDDTLMTKLVQTLSTAGQLVVWGTMELATELGREQLQIWLDGDRGACFTLASTIVKRVADLKREGFDCRIMTLKELQQEQQAVAIIQWMSALAFSCDPLCQTVADYIHPEKHLEPLLKADFLLSSRFTKAWYSLLLTLLAVPAFKSKLGAAYCETYENLTEHCATGRGVLEHSAHTLSVQFLNRDTYVLDLVTHRDLLSKLGQALLATLQVAISPESGRLDCNHVVLSHRRYSPCVSDLNYVINVKGMKRLTTCENGTFWTDLVAALSLAQGIDEHSWRHWDFGHVEDEDHGWYGAFNLCITLGGLCEKILAFEDDDASPIQNPTSRFSSGLLTCAGLSRQLLTNGLAAWQTQKLDSLFPTPYSTAVDSHRRRPASLPFSTVAAQHGCAVAFRQLAVGQMTPFSLHLPLHRLFAACIREICLRPDNVGAHFLLEGLAADVPKTTLNDIFQGLLEYPVVVLSRAAQVRAGLWRRNGPGLKDQVIKYADPTFCRSMRDSDLLLTQFAVLKPSLHQSPTPRPISDVSVATFVHLLINRLGLFDFVGLSKAPTADPDAYETETAKGLYPPESGETNGNKTGLVLPWTYSPARDASDCRALVEELLYTLIIFTTELPPPPPVDKTDHTNQAKLRLRREVIHRLAASPKTHSELADIKLVLSFRDNMLLDELGKSINPDDATAAMLGQVLEDVAERKASRSRLEPDKFVLLKSEWEFYDPAFFHISVESHQTAAESRPIPSKKDENGAKMPYAPSMPQAHPCFERLRRDVTADATVLAVAFRILHMHCRGSQRSDFVDLRVGRLAYKNEAKSETSLARAVHLLTLGCFAWKHAIEGAHNWRENGGGSPGSVFFDKEASPTASDWITAAFLADPCDLLDCKWYAGEENTLQLLRRLAVDGGASGVFLVQDPAVQAGAAWICEFAVEHCTAAANLMGNNGGTNNEGGPKNESEMERRKRRAKEKVMAKMNAQASNFARMMQAELDGTEDESGKLKKEETDFERRKREAKEKALARINNQAAKFAMGLELEGEKKAETELKKRQRLAKEKALARMNAQAAKFAVLNNIELDSKDEDDGEQTVKDGDHETDNKLLRERPQCIICSDSDAECFVAFSQGSTVLKGGGGPHCTDDPRMTAVRRFAGAYIALCGHAVHSDCSASYLAKVQQNTDQASGLNGEFRCPLCQRPSNCLVPFVDVGAEWIESPKCLPVTSEATAPSALGTFLASTPWWISRQNENYIWDGQGAFSDVSSASGDPAVECDHVSGEVTVVKNLMEHIYGIAFVADSKRLSVQNLQKDPGEFRHYTVEKHFYNRGNPGHPKAWPSCLIADGLSDSQLRSFSREQFLSQLLTSIQSLTYSASCEAYEARRTIREKTGGSRDDKAAATTASSDALKPVFSKFGICGTLCNEQLIVMPPPSSTEDEGCQPFNGRFGRLRNLGLVMMAAAGAVGPDLVQVVLPFPTKEADANSGSPRRAPIAHPLLLGHVLTHVVAAACAAAGKAIAPDSWRQLLKGNVELSNRLTVANETFADSIAEDCEGFMKLGLLARVLQVLCKEMEIKNAASLNTALAGLEMSEYDNGPVELEWMQSCRSLLVASSIKSQEGKTRELDTSISDKMKAHFPNACLVAAGAAAAFLADAGTIFQLLVPGMMARYDAPVVAITMTGKEKDSSIESLRMLQSFFKIESIGEMLKSELVCQVVANWFDDACACMRKASPVFSVFVPSPLVTPQSFRGWDWPLGSVQSYKSAVWSQQVSTGSAAGVSAKKTFPLLGGYNYDKQTKANGRPYVQSLTSSYMDLYAKVGMLKPDAERTAVCLICGEALDAKGIGACTAHSYKCGAGVGIFFLLQECTGIIMQRGEGSFIHSIYVDSHGETPRGRPLYLDVGRMNHLREIWFCHQVRQQVLAERENTQQGVITGYY